MNTNSRFATKILVTLGVIAVLLVLLGQQVGANRSTYLVEQAEQTQLASLQTAQALATTEIMRTSVNEKIAITSQKLTAIATSIERNPNASGQSAAMPTYQTIPTPIFETGIFTGSSPLAERFGIKGENQWKGVVDGHYVIVYAGAERSTNSGMLVVNTRTADLKDSTWQKFSVADSGSLRIVGDSSYVLALTGAISETILFDVKSSQFIPNGPAPMLLATPLP